MTGGVPSRICSAPGDTLGGSWGANNTIVWASRGSGLMRISAGGGMPQRVGDSAPAAWPEILPDGNTILFTTGTSADLDAIASISLDGAAKRIIARTTDSSLPGPPVLGLWCADRRGPIGTGRRLPGMLARTGIRVKSERFP